MDRHEGQVSSGSGKHERALWFKRKNKLVMAHAVSLRAEKIIAQDY